MLSGGIRRLEVLFPGGCSVSKRAGGSVDGTAPSDLYREGVQRGGFRQSLLGLQGDRRFSVQKEPIPRLLIPLPIQGEFDPSNFDFK